MLKRFGMLATPITNIEASETETAEMQVNSSGNFEVVAISGYSDGHCKIQILEQANEAPFNSEYISSEILFEKDNYYYLPEPLVLKANTAVNVIFQDLSGAENNAQLVFIGNYIK